jgi:hypothetical protein
MPSDVAPDADGPRQFDFDAEFSAIVSGISGQMQWDATTEELDAAASENVIGVPAEPPAVSGPDPWAPRPPSGTGLGSFDTADDRKRRREMRRLEREAELEAFQQAQAEIQAARDADDAHFEPPPPPPLPRPKRRTVGAVLLIVAGFLMLAWPGLLAVAGDVTLVLGLLLILAGLGLLLFGLRRRRGEPGDGWDDGAVV